MHDLILHAYCWLSMLFSLALSNLCISVILTLNGTSHYIWYDSLYEFVNDEMDIALRVDVFPSSTNVLRNSDEWECMDNTEAVVS